MISNLLYISNRNKNCTDLEIARILESCQRNNKGLDITGVLLYSYTHFVQYLEGEYKTIIELYDKIRTDERHRNVAMITTGQIDKRIFPSWQMGAKKVESSEIKFDTDISENDVQIFNETINGYGDNKAIDLMKKFFK
ncbi:MAG: BLUF domain-containing protein [Fulvivirga sp.]|uniref:BLUF domain-containing protein n=1 Tax=Fulvivirga sp. TaxID=1931237 RepID=UPI0032EC257F